MILLAVAVKLKLITILADMRIMFDLGVELGLLLMVVVVILRVDVSGKVVNSATLPLFRGRES